MVIQMRRFNLPKLVRIIKSERTFMTVLNFIILMHCISGFNNNLIWFGLNLIHGNIFINAIMISLAEITALIISHFFTYTRKAKIVYYN
jgi:hypothetical protein